MSGDVLCVSVLSEGEEYGDDWKEGDVRKDCRKGGERRGSVTGTSCVN